MASVMLLVGLFLVQIDVVLCAAIPQGMFTTQQYSPVNNLYQDSATKLPRPIIVTLA